MEFVDTHCHLYAEEFCLDYSNELDKARHENVNSIILPAIDGETHESLFKLAEQYSACYPLIGLHPTSVKENFKAELLLVEKYLTSKKVYGIGEVGIDLYWSKEYEKEQVYAFDYQIQLSLQHGLPLVIHSRDAFPEILDVLKSYKNSSIFGVFHAFTGDYDTYKKIAELGDFVVGVGGIVTFKNSGLANVVEQIPLDRIVLETDSPYLAPAPHRGKRNIPSYIPLIAAKVAAVKNVAIEQVAEATTANAKRIFKI